jgi:hypothetical protein
MKTKHKFTATIIGFICGLAILWIATNNSDSDSTKSLALKPTPKATTTNNSDLELYRDEVSYLQQDINSLQKQLNDLQQATKQNQAASKKLANESQESYQETHAADTNQDVELQPDLQQQREKEKITAQINTLEQQLQYEEPDPGWSIWAQDEIMNNISNKQYSGVSVVGNECRSTMCRFQFQFDDTEIRDTTVGDISSLVPWDSQGFFHTDENDPLNLVVYISREGTQLAQVE